MGLQCKSLFCMCDTICATEEMNEEKDFQYSPTPPPFSHSRPLHTQHFHKNIPSKFLISTFTNYHIIPPQHHSTGCSTYITFYPPSPPLCSHLLMFPPCHSFLTMNNGHSTPSHWLKPPPTAPSTIYAITRLPSSLLSSPFRNERRH